MTVIADLISSIDLWRLGNAVLAAVALGLGTFRLRKHWDMLGMGRLVVMSLMMFQVATIYGSIEQIHQHVPFGFRTALGTVANVWAVVAFLHKPTGATSEST